MSWSNHARSARRSPRCPAWLLGLVLAGCKIQEGGLDAGVMPAPPPAPAIPPVNPGPPGPPGPPPPTTPTPPPATDASSAPAVDAGSATPTPPPPLSPPPMVDAAPLPPNPEPALPALDASVPDVSPEAPAAIADPCAPPPGFLTPMVRLRYGRADDFTFGSDGHLFLFQNRDVVQLEPNQNTRVVVRNVAGFYGGSLRVLPDGDIVIADYGRDHLLRIDPQGRRADRAETQVRSPLKLAPAPGAPTAFYVTTQMDRIYRADVGTTESRVVADVDFRLGGIAVDAARNKLYVGNVTRGAVYAFDIDASGALGNRTLLADAVPQPTALAVDACGGVYIGGADGGALRRRAPTGATTVVATLPASDVTSLAFGSGSHGWSADSLFALDTDDGMLLEIRVKK